MQAPFAETISNKCVADVFNLNSERYVIPNYQRKYSWGIKELTEMMKDIIDAFNQNQKYSFGSIMVAKSYDTDDNAIYYVVDGQQRLTSFMFLLQAISKWTSNSSFWKYLNVLFLTYNHYGHEVSTTIVDEDFRNIENASVVDLLESMLIDSGITEEDLSKWILDDVFISLNILHYDRKAKKDEIYKYCLNRFIAMNSKGMKLVDEEVDHARKILKELE